MLGLAAKEGGITHLKLQKLLYYAQGAALALTGEPLFDDEIYAWKHGPVVLSVYQAYKKHKDAPILPKHKATTLPTFQQQFVSEVYAKYRRFDASDLVRMTHKEQPWISTSSSDEITQESIRHYFMEEVYTDANFLPDRPVVSRFPAACYDSDEDAYWESYL
jgi:uncharacterized phage-associated protein